MLVLSFTIPALTIENHREIITSLQENSTKVTYSNNGYMERDFVDDVKTANAPVNWNKILEYCYYSISTILICRMLFMMFRIQIQLRKHVVSEDDAIIFVNKKSTVKNCSFFNQIIVDSSLQPEEKNLVIKHEHIHIKQLHAVDKLLINLVATILWFNPIIYFWRNAIDDNHEFLADRETSKVTDKKKYAFLLLNLAISSKKTAINTFSKLPLKNRIMMMYKEPNVKFQKLVYVAVIPVLLICCMAFVDRKEIVVEKTLAVNQNQSIAAQKQNVYDINYLAGYMMLNPYVKSALKEVEPVLIIDAGHVGKMVLQLH
ncbi:M56 family metallopeptidase [Pedobacter mendelii]|uniref:Peptidase M56 domain-containing protein n=1 Tax=Pedobacter mendelii TaxID=1908240 RepID=A0ABQ2BC66_9SPHI|nr:M56 family metallopeptidase [Pedobacter mendelii]GGI22513.1 hypothetical protein GCM10008119_03020 [Pedobacter mendelii]